MRHPKSFIANIAGVLLAVIMVASCARPSPAPTPTPPPVTTPGETPAPKPEPIPAPSPTPTPIPTPEETKPAGKVTPSPNVSITLSSIQREENTTSLFFTVTKEGDTGPGPAAMTVALTDDHDNKYQGLLNVVPEGSPDNLLTMLPTGFTYVASISITMPRIAPIVKIQLGEAKEIAFRDVQPVKPTLKKQFGELMILPGESLSLSNYTTVNLGALTAEVTGWSLPVTVTNTDYNPITVETKVGAQLTDGTIMWGKAGAIVRTVPALSQETLQPIATTISEGMTKGVPYLLLISCLNMSSGKGVLRLMSITFSQWPPVPERIAFENKGDLYVAPVDGSGRTGPAEQLRLGSSFTPGDPAFSPDGSKIAFQQREVGETIDTLKIVVINADSSGITPLSDGSSPAWSPDGKRIAFAEGSYTSIINTDGSGKVRLGSGYKPSWSPDGNRIACINPQSQKSLRVIKTDGSILAEIPTASTMDINSVSWSPDGTRIAFAAYQGISLVNPEGKERLIESYRGPASLDFGEIRIYEGNANNVTWSPDGSRLAFDDGQYIYVINRNGSGKTRLMEGTNPTWTPALRLGS